MENCGFKIGLVLLDKDQVLKYSMCQPGICWHLLYCKYNICCIPVLCQYMVEALQMSSFLQIDAFFFYLQNYQRKIVDMHASILQ